MKVVGKKPYPHILENNGVYSMEDINRLFSENRLKGNYFQYFVVAGGGGGGTNGGWLGGGGGGGGGIRTNVPAISGGGNFILTDEPLYPMATGTYTVTVGGGGAKGVNGSDSVFGNITALGGGYANASSGGSGGGGGEGAATGGAGTANQGFAGGDTVGGWNTNGSGAGGGGAGEPGHDGSGTANNKRTGSVTHGGSGITTIITMGTTFSDGLINHEGYGGGGAGGYHRDDIGGTYGASYSYGGGANNGNGAYNGSDVGVPVAGKVNQGGGGGGSGGSGNGTNPGGSAGGSGVVIVRFPTTATSDFTISTTGSPFSWTNNGFSVYMYNSSGTLVLS
jgi:hypothetical protein